MSIKDDIGMPTTPDESTADATVASTPAGAAMGAGAGAVMGAAAGMAGGPVGALVGAAAGAAVGGVAGFGVDETDSLSTEDKYWRARHPNQPYAEGGRPYEDFERGYRTGYLGYREGESFEEREETLRAAYEADHPAEIPGTMQHAMSTRPLRWPEARPAVEAAYRRMAQFPP